MMKEESFPSANNSNSDGSSCLSPLLSGLALAIFLVLSVSFCVYAGNLLPPGMLGAALAGGVFLLLAAVAFLHFPHGTLIFLGVFLLIQELLAVNLAAGSTSIAQSFRHLDELLISIFFIITVFRGLSRKQQFFKTHIEIPLLGFILVAIIGSLIAKVPPGIAAIQLFLYLKGFLLLFIMLNLPVDRRVVRRYAVFFIGAGFVVLGLGMVDLIAPEWFRSATGNDPFIEIRYGIPSVKSIFVHPGTFGWFAALLSLYSFGFYMVYGHRRYLWLGLIFSGGSFLSMRRRNLIGIGLGLTVGLWQQSLAKKIRYGLVLGVLGGFFFILAWPKIKALYQNMAQLYVVPDNPMEEARNALYITSVSLMKEYFPWGAGLGRFGSWMSQVNYSPIYRKYGLSGVYGLTRKSPKYMTDTFWPAVLGETGFLGMLFFFWILARLGWLLYSRSKRTSDLFIRAFTLGTLMVLAESVIESTAWAVYTSPPIVYFIFGSVGLALGLSRFMDKSG